MDFPLNRSRPRRNAKALLDFFYNGLRPGRLAPCVHGHFMPLKYRGLRDACFVTWMRDPVERLGSHYHYWRRHFNPRKSPPLHCRVVQEDWSFERFCFSPQMRNVYTQFLWGFDVERFAFIGITESYRRETRAFSNRFLGTHFEARHSNPNPSKKTLTYFPDPGFRREVEEFHRKDMQLYQHAVRKAREQGRLE